MHEQAVEKIITAFVGPKTPEDSEITPSIAHREQIAQAYRSGKEIEVRQIPSTQTPDPTWVTIQRGTHSILSSWGFDWTRCEYRIKLESPNTPDHFPLLPLAVEQAFKEGARLEYKSRTDPEHDWEHFTWVYRKDRPGLHYHRSALTALNWEEYDCVSSQTNHANAYM
ncbi:hypothetical protein [Xanthomonas phage JGB6]|nr:hypothetical protein [Xanthomonas phage JGB6]